ncbi:PQ-loop repeat-containing protein 1-like protein [Dinothrombium tinctorium]|uniref:Solute carrier family 66 member 2 n=1 Tax=Dinothrombium tinctorium TaxID=1965070 RepID=A0A3S3QCY9_9ACAR|nr:PQ-loop repeat-containing protein 1-like protein [Dinothrombium tinctorium]RWS07271.1 PQ-loop repeat-containing protein 1-like protein [Dinothrombium tinctorium]
MGRTDDNHFSFEVPSFKEFLSHSASVAIIFGGVLPYIPQYIEIKRTENADGFSTYVCLVLLLANTMRILFWFGRYFELPLLIQSVVMNIAMLTIIELCVRVRNRSIIVPQKNRFFLGMSHLHDSFSQTSCFSQFFFPDLDPKYFWNWTDFISYIECVITFTVLLGALTYYFLDSPLYVEAIGFLALFTEAMLGAPQLVKNCKNKSTVGMSKKMVILWTGGDLFKTSYFVARNAPIQFLACGILQVIIDLLIILQVIFYRNSVRKHPKTQYIS